MSEFTQEERRTLASSMAHFRNWFVENVDEPVRKILMRRPKEVGDVIDKLNILVHSFSATPAPLIAEDSFSLIKRALSITRQEEAFRIEELSKKTSNHEIRNQLDEELRPFTSLTEQEWFKKTTASMSPKLTDYLSIQHALKTLENRSGGLVEREYDEKFQILLAPSLFITDLRYYRIVCGLRSKSVSVAYIDIDDFKNFNTVHGEPTVDREVLPKFMGALESHVFAHGYAYRYGGDEYVVLLPNMSGAEAIKYLESFQTEIAELKYFQIDDKVTVSIGLFEVQEGCFLTDREIEAEAAKAKNIAKENGKNQIHLSTI